MELFGHQISDACYFGCPSTDFEAIASRAAEVDAQVEIARGTGLSEASITAIEGQSATDRAMVENFVGGIPQDRAFAKPWRSGPETSKDAPSIVCCRYAGVIILGLSRKNYEPPETILSPAELAERSARAQQGDSE